MRAFDVLLEVLLLYISLVAVGIGTLEGPVVGMRSQVSGKTSGTIIDLVASRKGALNSLQLGREFAPWGELGKRGRLGGGMCRGMCLRVGILIGEIILDFRLVILI